jgi:hypothetical protein
MDQVIKALQEILVVTAPDISHLIDHSKHKILQSTNFGSRAHSVESTFEIYSPPAQTAQLSSLSEMEVNKILRAVHSIYPVKDNAPEIIDLNFLVALESNSGSASNSIRKDFKEIENELHTALLLSKTLQKLDSDWVHNKHEEDYDKINDQPFHVKIAIDIYAEGRSFARGLKNALESFNDVSAHGSIYSWVNSLEKNWLAQKEKYENIESKALRTIETFVLRYNSIDQMLFTLRSQIDLLQDVKLIIDKIKLKSIYQLEDSLLNKQNTMHTEQSEEVSVFLSHTSEDKLNFVEPLILELKKNEISYWYDKNEIIWGDSLVKRINEGLAKSRYCIFFLSTRFIKKNWPVAELEAIINIETTTGTKRVLPLLIGSDEEINLILKQYPLLAGKLYKKYSDGIDLIVNDLLQMLKNT